MSKAEREPTKKTQLPWTEKAIRAGYGALVAATIGSGGVGIYNGFQQSKALDGIRSLPGYATDSGRDELQTRLTAANDNVTYPDRPINPPAQPEAPTVVPQRYRDPVMADQIIEGVIKDLRGEGKTTARLTRVRVDLASTRHNYLRDQTIIQDVIGDVKNLRTSEESKKAEELLAKAEKNNMDKISGFIGAALGAILSTTYPIAEWGRKRELAAQVQKTTKKTA